MDSARSRSQEPDQGRGRAAAAHRGGVGIDHRVTLQSGNLERKF